LDPIESEKQKLRISWYLICGLAGILARLLFKKDINGELSLLADPGPFFVEKIRLISMKI
jgi:hypothetical protein